MDLINAKCNPPKLGPDRSRLNAAIYQLLDVSKPLALTAEA